MKKIFVCQAAIISVAVLAAGCASVAVSNDAIEQRTASALGLASSSFTISDRVDDGVKASYTVKTKSGKQYSCYVTGGVSVMGRMVSDPVCNELGKSPKQAVKNSSSSCNAVYLGKFVYNFSNSSPRKTSVV